MQNFWSEILGFFSGDDALNIIKAVIIVIAGLLIARLVSRGLVRAISEHADAHHRMLIRRIAYYTIAGIFVATALVELGFDFGILLGAAGILTIALGFASQTSATNIISGLFLLGERPFSVGDIIRIGTTTGEVLSIDLLSVKLRTFDNLFVRVANENLIKSEITNVTRFPIRRLDLQIGVAYREDLRQVFEVLYRVADANPLSLDEPKPRVIYQGFGDSSLDFQFSIWVQREYFVDLKRQIHIEIKEAFDAAGIEIPFPHRSLYTGSMTEPFPIRMVSEAPRSDSATSTSSV